MAWNGLKWLTLCPKRALDYDSEKYKKLFRRGQEKVTADVRGPKKNCGQALEAQKKKDTHVGTDIHEPKVLTSTTLGGSENFQPEKRGRRKHMQRDSMAMFVAKFG